MKKLFIALLVSISALSGAGFFLRGKVVAVADGDTLTVFTRQGRFERIRLYGVDCPETGQRHGREATEYARDRAMWQEISYTILDTDRYGRRVALISLPDGGCLNAELVQKGHAWVYDRYCAIPVCAQWKIRQKEARRAGAGLWRSKNPEPPWQWRKRNARR